MTEENEERPIPRGIWPDKEEFPSERWPPAAGKSPDQENSDRIFTIILLIFFAAAVITTLRFMG